MGARRSHSDWKPAVSVTLQTPPAPDALEPASQPPRLSTVRALWRLREYAGPAMPAFAGSMAAALVAQLIALTIPQVLQQIVDGPLAKQEADAVIPLAVLVFVLGAVEAILFAVRRWLVVGPGTRVEARMRNALYAKLQDLPVNFHDRWPSGQLLSRAVSDLGLIRRWLSFGLVLTGANVVIIVVGVGILMSMNWFLGLIFLVCSLPLWWAGWRFEGRYSEMSRLSQDQAKCRAQRGVLGWEWLDPREDPVKGLLQAEERPFGRRVGRRRRSLSCHGAPRAAGAL